MASRATRSLSLFLLIAALHACGGDDAAIAGSGATGGDSGQGGTGGDSGQGGTGGDSGQGGTGGDSGQGGTGGDSGQGGTGGDSGQGGNDDEDSGVAGTGGDYADAGVDAAMTIECEEGTQDNDGDGTCSASCTDDACGNGECDDSSGIATCECDEGWAGENCGACAPGYRNAIVVIGSPAVCELDTPATTNMRMWLDADHNDSFTFLSGKVIEWRSRAPSGVGGVVDGTEADSRPTRVSPVRNGRRVVRFDGVDDRLEGQLDLRSATYSIFVVAKASSAKAGEQFFMHGLGATNITRNMRLLARENAGSLRYRHVMPGGSDEVNNADADTSSMTLIETHRSATLVGHSLSTGIDGDLESILTEQATFDETLNVALGRQKGASLLGALEGDIGEVIVFVPAIAPASRPAVRAYLNAKWRL